MRVDSWMPILVWVIGAPFAAAVTAGGAYMFRMLVHVNKQMRNNGGTSLLDKIERIEKTQDKLVAWQERQDRKLRKLEKMQKMKVQTQTTVEVTAEDVQL